MEQHVAFSSRKLLVCMILACTALPAFCQNAIWTGQVQCQLSVQANGYTHQETQTWKLTGAAPTMSGTIEAYPANWSSSGQGVVQQPTRTAQWTVNAQPMSAPLAIFVRSSDSRLVVKSYHSLLYSPSGVTGTQMLSTRGTLQYPANEWTLPVIGDSPTSMNVSGSATIAISPTLLPLETSTSPVGTANCTWQFSKGTNAAVTSTASPTPLAVSTPQLTGTTTSNPVLNSIQAQNVTSSGPAISGHTSDGAPCSQHNPRPSANSGLSHAYQSVCNIQFSDSQWKSVASWSFPNANYAIFVIIQPDHLSPSTGSIPPSYVCTLVETGGTEVGLGSLTGEGSQQSTRVGLSYYAVSAVTLQCAANQPYNAVVSLVLIQIGALN